MEIDLRDGRIARWVSGSHTVNLLDAKTLQEVDAFTFAWEHDATTQLQMLEALQTHLRYEKG